MATAPQLKIVKSKKAREQEGAKKDPARTHSVYSEDPRAQFLRVGTDARGKHAYFFQMNITGLRPRVFGPYATRSAAIEGFDSMLIAALEAFCDVPNREANALNSMEHIAPPDDLQACQ